jgi:TPR repeat protein
MPFQFIESVTGGFTLIAFLIACIAWIIKIKINNEKELIDSADNERKEKLVKEALEKFHIDTTTLTKQQKFELLMKRMNEKRIIWTRIGLLLLLFSVMVATITFYIYKDTAPKNLEKEISKYLNNNNLKKANNLYFFKNNKKDALILYDKESRNDNPFAQASLAKLYFMAWGALEDKEEASHLTNKSLSKLESYKDIDDKGWAYYNLAYLYNNGIGIKKNEKTSYEYYKKAKLKGNFAALNNLASFYEEGEANVKKNIAKAIELYEKSFNYSNKKYHTPAKNLGRIFSDTEYEEYSNEKAFYWYEIAAKLGNKDAMYYLGKMYSKGNYIKRDDVKAFDWYEKSMEKGNENAKFQVAYAYNNGIGVKKDLKNAVELYKDLKNDTTALNNLGIIYEYGGKDDFGFEVKKDEVKAVEYYEDSIEKGGSYAFDNLGELYLFGTRSIDKNYEKAYSFFSRGEEKGDKNSLSRLGYMYRNGFHVRKDIDKAIIYYKEAAKKEHVQSMVVLGDIYRYAKNNKTESLQWYKKALIYKTNESYIQMALVYRDGWGVEKDYDKALKLLLISSKNNNARAMFFLGELYLEKDKEKAFNWILKGAKNGNRCAKNSTGNNYFNGVGVKKDYKEAKLWFERSVKEDNFMHSYYNLGVMYEKALGVEKNYEKAIEYYNKGIDNTHKKSLRGLYRILSNKNYKKYDLKKAEKYLFKLAAEGDEKAIETLKRNAQIVKMATCSENNSLSSLGI